VARHNIPDAAGRLNVSTSVGTVQKRLSQIFVYQKNLARAPMLTIRDTCLVRLSILNRLLASHFAQEKEFVIAASFARVARAYQDSIKWRFYSWYLAFRARLKALTIVRRPSV